jgi:hypothetical protein
LKAFSASFVLLLALPLCAQAPKNSQAPTSRSSDERIAVIEAKLATLDKLNDRLDKLQDKLNDLSNQLVSLNTKMSVVIWIGTAVGGLLIAQLFAGFTKDRKVSREVDDYGRGARGSRLDPVLREELRVYLWDILKQDERWSRRQDEGDGPIKPPNIVP